MTVNSDELSSGVRDYLLFCLENVLLHYSNQLSTMFIRMSENIKIHVSFRRNKLGLLNDAIVSNILLHILITQIFILL